MYNNWGWEQRAKEPRSMAIRAVARGLEELNNKWDYMTVGEIRDIIDDICLLLKSKKPE